MKDLLHRLSALLLAVLVLAASVPLIRAEGERPDPACTLGTFSGDMLVGGSEVLTDAGLFYIGEDDGYIYNQRSGARPVVSERAAKLNYAKGVLYYARLHESSFDLVSFELATRKQTVYLENFSGSPRQVYLVNGERLDFLCDNIIWELQLSDSSFRMVRFAQDLWSFVPTGCGMIYATGTIFDYNLYAGNYLLADHVESYYVDFDLAGGAVVYTRSGEDFQMDLASAFLGDLKTVAFQGVTAVNVSNDGTATAQLTEEEVLEREAVAAEHADDNQQEILNREENRPIELAPAVDNSVPEQTDMEPEDYLQDPQATSAEEPDAAPASAEAEPAPAETEPAPVETEPAPAETEPAPAETEPAPVETEPAPVPAEENRSDSEQPEPEQTSQAAPEQLVNVPSVDAIYPPDELNETDDEVRRPLTTGQQNIVKRAEQMLSVRWTPRKKITGWGNTFSYEAGVTYTGLPYGQPVNAAYVPWTASLTEFVNAVNNPNSLMYTSRSEYYKVAPYYSVDCSAFVSWAWDLPHRCTTRSIGSFGKLISSNSYANIQVGDMLNNVTSHVILVTDVTYDSTGALTGIRISQASPQASYYGCCRSTWYRGSTGLATFRSNYFNSGYALYRSLTRENVTYTHDCAVPLEGDECAICGVGMLLKPGVDVSQWQGVIDWQTIAAHISFAILRIGYHGKDGKLYLDKQFEANVTGCVNNGIPYGVYFYSLATDAASAKAEAEFVRTKLNGRALTLPVFMGVENSDTILTDSMTAAKLLTITSAFCSNLGSYEPGIYASESPWNSLMTDPAYNNWARWVAKWKTPDGNATGSVTMPLNASGGANVWQYGANRLPGVTMTDKNGTPTMIDVDYWFGPVGNTEHRYTANITSPSCTKTGWLTYRCVDCGQKVSKNLAAPGHFFMDGICKRCGKEETTFDHFTDLNENAWYAEAVSFVLDRGYFHGVSETKFAPSEKMTRAMLVTVLYRIAGEPSVPSGSLFDDVSAGAYYANAVTWAANNGITNGTDERHFSPNQPITREETAVFLYRYAALVGGMSTSLRADLSAFPDAGDISVFARDAVSWAVAMDILRGTLTDNGILIQPKRDANRAEIATLLMRFVLRQEQKAP